MALGRQCKVAPYAGAWIETGALLESAFRLLRVAPYAGAWIETAKMHAARKASHVAPYAGAWIETAQAIAEPVIPKSPPTRGRGSKRFSASTTRLA